MRSTSSARPASRKSALPRNPPRADSANFSHAMQIQDDKPYDEINITPMLDLAYVLLVIFILMTTATVQGIKASLPRGSNAAKSKSETKIKAISIDDAGKIYLDKEELNLATLEARLTVAKAAHPNVPVI